MNITAYHSHIYFDQTTLAGARAAGEAFPLSVGNIIERPVGPHPMWSCQLAYKAALLNQILPWLAANRGAHTVSGNDWWDHTQGTIWMGSMEKLNLEFFDQESGE